MTRTSGDETAGEKRRGGPTARSVLLAVKRRPLTLFGVTVLAAGVGAAVWLFLPLPKSTAAVVFHVAPTRPSILEGSERGGGAEALSFRSSQATLVRRRMTLNRVLNQPSVQQLAVVRKQPDPLSWLENGLKVETKRDSDFLRVTLEGESAEELQTVLEALSAVYLAEVDERDKGAQRERLRKLEQTNQNYRAEIERFHKRIDTIAVALGSKDGPTLAVMDSMLQEELRAARRELTEARNNLQLAILPPVPDPNRPPAAAPPVAAADVEAEFRADPALKEIDAEVTKAQQALTETQLLFRTGGRPRAVTEAEDKLAAAKAKRDKYRADRLPEVTEVIRKRNAEKEQIARLAGDALKRREELAKTKVTEIQKGIEKANVYRLELEDIKSLIGQTEKLSESLVMTIERLKVDLGAATRVTQSDEPHVIPGLEGNRRLKFTLLALLGVLGVGFTAVVGWEHRSRRLTHATEVADALGVRLIGSVPVVAQGPGKAGVSSLVLAEAIDATRTLLVNGTEGPDLRALVVTSAVSGEGKTSLSGHLAISLARAGFRTLLIDGDLRAPTAQRVFDVPLAPGLCEALAGGASAADAVKQTGVPRLFVLPAGEWTVAVHQLLVGNSWRVLKEQLKAEFDYIVIDTSPLLMVSDSLLLAREADGVVVSVLIGVSQVALVEEAVSRIQSVRANLVGVIANGATEAAYAYTYGYGYGYGYGGKRADESPALPAGTGG